MSDLKPCPCKACGSDNYAIHRTWNRRKKPPTMVWYVSCDADDCGAQGPVRATRDEAVAAWSALNGPDSLTLTAAVQGEREAIKAQIARVAAPIPALFLPALKTLYIETIYELIDARTSPAVDVIPDALRKKVREFIAMADVRPDMQMSKAQWLKLDEIRSLVAASPKAEKKENA